MNVLQQLRALAASEGASPPHPVPTPAQPPSAATAAHTAACPFAFGPWLPRTDPQAHPGEAQRAVLLGGALIAWWRREWVGEIIPLPGEPPWEVQAAKEALGAGFPSHQILDPSGRWLFSSGDSQIVLEHLAERLGVA